MDTQKRKKRLDEIRKAMQKQPLPMMQSVTAYMAGREAAGRNAMAHTAQEGGG